ncbi:MAG: hypothetical protein WEC80_02355 [Patescibacteria group bacterium]
MNKVFFYLFVAFCIVVLSAVGTYYYITSYAIQNFTNKVVDENTVFCTQEAKLCPDGSYVGREGPNCEFTQCPK